MWHGIVPVPELSCLCHVWLEGSFVPPRNDGSEGDLAI